MIRVGIVICSRLASSRLPNKAHLILENKTVISHLVNNLKNLNLPIVVTVPNQDFHNYLKDESFPRHENILIHPSEHSDDPLARTHQVAKQFQFDYVIRITHDKIFIDTDSLKEAIEVCKNEKAEYLFASNLVPGSNFEIIGYRALSEAAQKFKNVEYLSYAVRTTSQKTINFNKDNNSFSLKDVNLLLDYEEDFKLFQVIFSRLGSNAIFKNVMAYLSLNRDLININKKPLVTIYTCAYNSQEFLSKAIESVLDQTVFNRCEYILIDDCSSDATFEMMSIEALGKSNISYYRNQRNIGLASSSNIALSKSRGKYIIRIDSDDFFNNENVIKEMVEFIESTTSEILYPDNYYGSLENIQKGKDGHHVGGALFNKNALNFIKFTDGLRGHEGYDLFLRAKDRLKIGYFEKPCFFYTRRQGSLSTTGPRFRSKIKQEIETRLKVRA